jgi:hypothetical protein
MQRNVASFANAFASAAGFVDSRVTPRADLSGTCRHHRGRARRHSRYRPTRRSGRTRRQSRCAPQPDLRPAFRDPRAARRSPLHAWRRAPCGRPRGLGCVQSHDAGAATGGPGREGWATLLVSLDDVYANKLKYPTSTASAATVDAEMIARRWLLIPMTRANHLLVIHVRDASSPVAARLREAADAMPKGVVEWTTPASFAEAARVG